MFENVDKVTVILIAVASAIAYFLVRHDFGEPRGYRSSVSFRKWQHYHPRQYVSSGVLGMPLEIKWQRAAQ